MNTTAKFQFAGLRLFVLIFCFWSLSGPVAADAPLPPMLCKDGDACIDEPKVKWHPGHYMQLRRNKRMLTDQSARFAQYDSIATSQSFVGVFTPFIWSELEGDMPGDFSRGIDTVRAEIDYLKSLPVPKRFILRLIDLHFGATDPENSFYYPAYIRERGHTYQGGNAIGWCRWNANAMDRYIAMVKAYAAAFDNEPFFEGIVLFRESAPTLHGIDSPPCEYTAAQYVEQTARMVREIKPAFPRSNVLLSLNYMVNQEAVGNMLETMAASEVGISGPDIFPADCATFPEGTWGHRALTGEIGGQDFRGIVPSIWSTESTQMGGALGNCTPDQIFQSASTDLHASHIGWDKNTFIGDPDTQQWPAIVRFVNDQRNTIKHIECPEVYKGKCDSE